jgi:hypothetical protein
MLVPAPGQAAETGNNDRTRERMYQNTLLLRNLRPKQVCVRNLRSKPPRSNCFLPKGKSIWINFTIVESLARSHSFIFALLLKQSIDTPCTCMLQRSGMLWQYGLTFPSCRHEHARMASSDTHVCCVCCILQHLKLSNDATPVHTNAITD